MRTILVAIAAFLLVGAFPAQAQQQSQAAPSQEELDKLLAPIALYPDPLLAQVLMASTYPLEVVMAARWVKDNPKVTGKALEDAMQKQAWDPSVKGLTAVPTVLDRMSENLGWMHKLGDAFLADQAAVMTTVQGLRAKAQAQGNLKTTAEQTVRTETVEDKSVIVVEPAQAETIYVPTYDPVYAYGPWWYSYPPYSMYPYGYYYAPGVAFAAGIFVGAAIWGGIGWGGNNVYVNHNNFNNFNRDNIGSGNRGDRGNWNHNVDHRKGVAYGNDKAAQKFNRGGDAAAARSREQFRARSDSGRGFSDRAQAQNRAGDRAGGGQARDRASSGSRGGDFGGARSASVGTRDIGSRNSSGFSGSNFGSSSRAASSRGSSSRGSMGGGSRGGGGRGGGRR